VTIPTGVETAVGAGGFAALWIVLVAGVFIGLTPGAYLAGPAVLGYLHVGDNSRRWVLIGRAGAYVLGAAIPTAVFGLLVGFFGDVVLIAVGERIVLWYLLVVVVTTINGLLLTGMLVARLPSFLPKPRPVGSARGAFFLGLPLGLAACPACTPLLFPIASVAAVSGGPLYGAGLLLLFGLGRGVPILIGAISFAGLQKLRRLIPFGLSVQRIAGWLLLATAGFYVLQIILIRTGRAALFA